MYQIINCYQENQKSISNFKTQSRFLWDDHISYTRNVIISAIANLPDTDIVSTRLIKNQDDIGDFISPYYTTDQVKGFVILLKQHISMASNVIKGVENAEAAFRSNCTDIVNYMYNMNPIFWSSSVTTPVWNSHVEATVASINARKTNMWDDDIKAYDLNHHTISQLSDIFSTGIIYQNMEKFCFKE